VEAGFLELAQPTIGEAFDRLVQRGATQIRVCPLLLFAAGHARSDVPEAIQRAAARHSEMRIEIGEPFGCGEWLLALSKRRYDEAVAPAAERRGGTLPRGAWERECYLLLVGRGSSDATATAEMNRFAELRVKQSSLDKFGVAFVAAAHPTLDEGLEQAAAAGVRQIVVQPHLLFRGEVLATIQSAVARWQTERPELEWITTSHLGPEQELVQAVLRPLRRARSGASG
jgi:sirohydrochlorin cobaltochelatase